MVLDSVGASQLEIPGGAFLLDADFSREGPDLLLIGEDGTTVLILDFFATGEPPILVTADGARIVPELAEALAGPVAPGQYAQAGDAALGEPIGSVETTDGSVTATRVEGSTVALSVGSPVFQGDVLETGGGGAVGIVFVDSSTFSLDENGRMVLDEMVFDPGSGTGTSAFSVVKGVFTFVSGQIAQSGSDAMTVTTPVMSIGIRGTKVAGVAAAEGSDNTVTLLANDDGSGGEISLTNSGGVVLLNVANQTSTITSFNLPPAAPVILPAAAVQNLYGDALNALPPSPTLPTQQQAAADAGPADAAPLPPGEDEEAEEEDAADDGEAVDGEEEAGDEEEAEGEEGEGPEGEVEVAALEGEGPDSGSDGAPDGPEPDGPGDPPLGEPVNVEASRDETLAQNQSEALSKASKGFDLSSFMDFFGSEAGRLGGPFAVDADLVVAGGRADEELIGTKGRDVISGRGGVDIILGGKGSDALSGGAGNDFLSGGPGNDLIRGNSGDDILEGNSGDDSISGGTGDDLISGGPGRDTLAGNAGKDIINGNAGDDFINGNGDDDTLSGNGGNDTIEGGSGNDTIRGNGGNDILDGKSGDDTIKGGQGDDLVVGGTGNDTLEGGADDDILKGKAGDDTLDGGNGNDTIQGDGGNDILDGGSGENILDGGNGDDVLAVQAASSGSIDGGKGTDTLRLDGSGFALNLNTTTVDIDGIEIIDMGSGSDTLTLGLQDVLDISNTTNTLNILGAPGDTVAFLDTFTQGNTQVVDGVTFNIFSSGQAQVLIDQDITNITGAV